MIQAVAAVVKACFYRLATLVLLAPVAVVAESDNVIEWDAARPLSWADFLGPVRAGGEDQRVAATAGSLSWSYEYRVEWSRDSCRYSILNIRSQALFHPDDSWVRPQNRTDDVLQHEQGHFDILQLYKQRFDSSAREYLGTPRTCRGRNERSATRNANNEVERLLGPIYEAIWLEYRSHQDTYDRVTRHGIDAEAQAEWTRNLDRLLRNPPGP